MAKSKKSEKPRAVYLRTIWDSDGPTVDIKKANIEAIYFDDGSGEVTLIDECGDVFLHKESLKLKEHIEYIREYMAQMKKQITICKKSLKTLKKIKI